MRRFPYAEYGPAHWGTAGLLNSDIDLEHKFIKVRQNVKEVCKRDGVDFEPGREVKVGKTKTATSRSASVRKGERFLPLNQAAVQVVKGLRQERYFGPNSPLVSDEKGNYTRPVNFRKRYYRILKAAGIEQKGRQGRRHRAEGPP